jgi:hypothetical protein
MQVSELYTNLQAKVARGLQARWLHGFAGKVAAWLCRQGGCVALQARWLQQVTGAAAFNYQGF